MLLWCILILSLCVASIKWFEFHYGLEARNNHGNFDIFPSSSWHRLAPWSSARLPCGLFCWMMTKTVRGDDLSESAEEAEQVTRDPLRINEELGQLGPSSDKGECGEWRSCETWRQQMVADSPPNPLKIDWIKFTPMKWVTHVSDVWSLNLTQNWFNAICYALQRGRCSRGEVCVNIL